MGWGWACALSEHADLHILTQHDGGNKERIDRLRAQGLGLHPSATIHYLPAFLPPADDPDRARVGASPVRYYRAYRRWQWMAFLCAQKIVKDNQIDIVHHLNMTGYREPGYLWRLDRPFVIGPVGGFLNYPWSYMPILRPAERVRQSARSIVNTLTMRLDRRVARALRTAAVVLAATSADAEMMRRCYGLKALVTGDAACGPMPDRPRRIAGNSLTLVSSGLHIARKSLPVGLHALALLGPDVPWTLHLLGEGPETPHLRELADGLGIKERIVWHGWRPRAEAIEIMKDADIFLFPSLLEGSATVVMEALSLGLPVVCFDCCGMHDSITPGCGIAIPTTPASTAASRFAAAIQALWRSPETREKLADGARARAQELSYPARAAQVVHLYQSLVGAAGHRP